MLITSSGQQLQNGSRVDLDNTSIGFAANINMYLVLAEPLETLTGTTTAGWLSPYTVSSEGVVTKIEKVTESSVVAVQQSSKWIYKINHIAESDTAAQLTANIDIGWTTENETGSVNVAVHMLSVEMDQRLAVTLQNFKRTVSEEWMTAIKDTQSGAASIDWTIWNRKVREFLMSIDQIDGMLGSYKSLLSALGFFGYGDLLEIREYWKSVNSEEYKLTAIQSQILDKVDKTLAGYKKTSQMALVYQINATNEDDEDGLPIYVNVLSQTDDILFKLWALERILEREFLYMNTHIVDIVGEFQSAMGLELNAILNEVHIIDVNLSEESYYGLTITPVIGSMTQHCVPNDAVAQYDNDRLNIAPEVCTWHAKIKRHTVMLTPWRWSSGDPLVKVNDATMGHFTETIFDVDRLVPTDTEEYDVLTKLHSGDFAMLSFDVNLETARYQSFRYIIRDENDDVQFNSAIKDISQFTGQILCGIRETGNWECLIYAFDHYGGYTIVAVEGRIQVSHEPVQVLVGALGNGARTRGIQDMTTFTDTTAQTGYPVVSGISETLDIMNWDPIDNIPEEDIARYYESDFDQVQTWTNLSQLNGIPLTAMAGLPLHVHGYAYCVFVADVIGDSAVGTRTIGLALFKNKPLELVTLDYDGSEEPTEFLQKLINLLNDKPATSIFSKFTYDMHRYADDPDAELSDARLMLRAKGKAISFRSSNFILSFESTYQNSDFIACSYKKDVQLFSKADAHVKIAYLTSATDDLILTLNGTSYAAAATSITSHNELLAALQSIQADNDLHDVFIIDGGKTVNVWADSDLAISHNAFGTQQDIRRGLLSNSMLVMPLGFDVRLGEPVFAFIDQTRRFELANIVWTLTDTLTGAVVTTQRAWSFRWVMSKVGTYTVTVAVQFADGTNSAASEQGCYLVT